MGKQAANDTAQDIAYARIKEGIVNLELAPGRELRTSALAADMGVSRTPVREALSRLQQDGLVTRLSGWGYAVRSMSLREIVDLFALRETLEVMAVDGAVTAITSEQVRDMEIALKKSERLLAAGKLAEFRATLRSFHMIIAEATGNSLLEQMLGLIDDRVRLVAAMQFSRQSDRPNEVIKENERILQALVNRDRTAAREAVLTHLRNAREIFASHSSSPAIAADLNE